MQRVKCASRSRRSRSGVIRLSFLPLEWRSITRKAIVRLPIEMITQM
jgi:hypothetical protein